MSLCSDGVFTFTRDDAPATFHPLPAPDRTELQDIAFDVPIRTLAWLRRRGLLRGGRDETYDETDSSEERDRSALGACLAQQPGHPQAAAGTGPRGSDCAGKIANQVAEVRFQAERLTRSDALSFGQVSWIKAGLIAVLDALDALEPGHQRAASWSSAARQAVVSIDAQDLLGFQRPAIQDAFRATVDAFGVAARSIPECPG